MDLFNLFKKEKMNNCIDYAKKFKDYDDNLKRNFYNIRKVNKLLKSWEDDFPNDPNLYYAKLIAKVDFIPHAIKNHLEFQELRSSLIELNDSAKKLQESIPKLISKYDTDNKRVYLEYNQYFQDTSKQYLFEFETMSTGLML